MARRLFFFGFSVLLPFGLVLHLGLVLYPSWADDFPVSLQDGTGRHVTLTKPAERIIALSKGSLST